MIFLEPVCLHCDSILQRHHPVHSISIGLQMFPKILFVAFLYLLFYKELGDSFPDLSFFSHSQSLGLIDPLSTHSPPTTTTAAAAAAAPSLLHFLLCFSHLSSLRGQACSFCCLSSVSFYRRLGLFISRTFSFPLHNISFAPPPPQPDKNNLQPFYLFRAISSAIF
ncbi:unnamed protein product [Acanthosepion pharaonis]|uniref:Uncharacterized protein n=1 Tax=Acanthosepion pharaonis TaxID=158019 RepID=A0A812C4U4_ACAPH|nr:unnamed protein product [Sepia pharaonis]